MMTLDVNEIRAKWSALQGVTGLVAPIQDEEGYERMVALADALIESGLASDAGELADLFAMVSTLIADFDAQHYVVPSSSSPDIRLGSAL
ncbi:hypothetical protein [Alcaligenes endophyticus]|uniref:Transcriptional regulator n=1 Tax=Alcaligenes endophyticus TaxID=1929088 RepID=A0ABT8EK03_9BURK|nr:hypothetical protein [Alcaligenes endophyticus]MCX5591929.1 hypothetical protein [Alcaligenes endophyticus]MDN4121619.1 hypothetical protein [Alcaligenes endophyticus]